MSPVNNDVLQKYVIQNLGKPLRLLTDTRTRWNLPMYIVQQFISIVNPLEKVMLNLEIGLIITNKDITLLRNLLDALLPVELIVKTLCGEDCTILVANASIGFALQELRDLHIFVVELANSLKKVLLCI